MQGVKQNGSYHSPSITDRNALEIKTSLYYQTYTVTGGNTIYYRDWSGSGSGEIIKLAKTSDDNGVLDTVTHANGAWADRASLSYVGIDIPLA